MLVARALGSTLRIPRSRAEGGLKYEPRAPHRYAREELADIAQAIEAEVRLGATPQWWENVAAGDVLLILESMKMEMPIEAPDAGTVGELRCKETDAVAEGQVLVVLV